MNELTEITLPKWDMVSNALRIANDPLWTFTTRPSHVAHMESTTRDNYEKTITMLHLAGALRLRRWDERRKLIGAQVSSHHKYYQPAANIEIKEWYLRLVHPITRGKDEFYKTLPKAFLITSWDLTAALHCALGTPLNDDWWLLKINNKDDKPMRGLYHINKMQKHMEQRERPTYWSDVWYYTAIRGYGFHPLEDGPLQPLKGAPERRPLAWGRLRGP